MGRMDVIGERDGWRCWLCDEPVDPDMSVNDGRGPSIDSLITDRRAKKKSARPPVERLAHRGCNTGKGKVKPVVPWAEHLFVIDPAVILTSVDRLARKGGREVMARCPDDHDASEAADWLIDRVSAAGPRTTAAPAPEATAEPAAAPAPVVTPPSAPAPTPVAPALLAPQPAASAGDQEQELPVAELRSLRQVAAWSSTELELTIYNGTAWRITEIYVRIQRYVGNEVVDDETPVTLVPPRETVDEGVASLLSKVAPDRRKPGVNANDTGKFSGQVGPPPEGFRCEIVSARGYPPS